MKFLSVGQSLVVLKLGESGESGPPLVEQAHSRLAGHPLVLLDVAGMQLNSMQIGELVNLQREFDRLWQDRPHWIGLVNVSAAAIQVLQIVKLDRVFPLFESLTEAWQAAAAVSKPHP